MSRCGCRKLYDPYQQLCKTVRPDVVNTAFSYNALGQLTWQTSGSSVSGSTTGCDTSVTASAKADYTYDNLGNIRTVTFGDSSPSDGQFINFVVTFVADVGSMRPIIM